MGYFLWVLHSYAHARWVLFSVLPPLHGCYACDPWLLVGVEHVESITESRAREDGLGAVEHGMTWLCVTLTGLQAIDIGSMLGVPRHRTSTRVDVYNPRGFGPPPAKDLTVQDIARWDEDRPVFQCENWLQSTCLDWSYWEKL